jgi:DNA-binding transcriptional LysR family regulator
MKLSGIDTNLLLALNALLVERSVTRAAARVGVGQPAMSHSLARLRKHFNDPLLVPKGRVLVLTERALSMTDAVASAVSALAEIFEERPAFDPQAPRTFVLASTDLFALRFLPELLELVAATAPGVKLELRPLLARSSDQILTNGVEIAFGVFEDVPQTLNQSLLFRDPFVCIVRADHPCLQGELSLATYLELSHLEVRPAPGAHPGVRIDRALSALGKRRRIGLRVPYFLVAAELLERTDYVMTVTLSSAKALLDRADLAMVVAPIELPSLAFSLIWRRVHDTDSGHRWLREVAARIICNQPLVPGTGPALSGIERVA